MDEIGGHSLTIAFDDRLYDCTVANPDRAEAKRLALAHVGGGKVIGVGTALWESDIAALRMRPNEVKVATILTPERVA